LMGSPTSFVVLCIINLALSRYALELRLQRSLRLTQTGILVNGDDIGFVTDSSGYNIWKHVTASGGLSPSPGKNYTSRNFIILNSTLHVREDNSWKFVPYVNMGILQGRNENGTPIEQTAQDAIVGSEDPRCVDLAGLANDLIKGHPEPVQLRLLKEFIRRWEPALKKFCPRGMSYFLPRHLGGLGLPIIGDWTGKRDRFSRQQRQLATFLAHDHARARELQSMNSIRSNESVSLWEEAMPELKQLEDKVPHFYAPCTKEVRQSVETADLQDVTAYTLAKTLVHSKSVGLEVASEGPTRYEIWRSNYEKLFRRVERSTFAPASDDDISSFKPFERINILGSVKTFSRQFTLQSANLLV